MTDEELALVQHELEHEREDIDPNEADLEEEDDVWEEEEDDDWDDDDDEAEDDDWDVDDEHYLDDEEEEDPQDESVAGFIIWPADKSYASGPGVDGDVYDTEDSARESQWVTARELGYVVLPYIPGEEINWPDAKPADEEEGDPQDE